MAHLAKCPKCAAVIVATGKYGVLDREACANSHVHYCPPVVWCKGSVACAHGEAYPQYQTEGEIAAEVNSDRPTPGDVEANRLANAGVQAPWEAR
jgi:hypothetical protein